MVAIYQAELDRDIGIIQQLYTDYLTWLFAVAEREFGKPFDVQRQVAEDLAKLEMFRPPDGCLLVASEDGQPAGMGGLRRIGVEVGELKRMYVVPAFRSRGIGRVLLAELTARAATIGYPTLRLDSAFFMTTAHALYRSAGFYPIAPYSGSEIPAEYQPYWLYMEKRLVP